MTWCLAWAALTLGGPHTMTADAPLCDASDPAACAAGCKENGKACAKECSSLRKDRKADCLDFCKRKEATCAEGWAGGAE